MTADTWDEKADGGVDVKRVYTFLCGIAAAALVSGCGADMPELTREETDLISEYAVGVLLKYDKDHVNRLVDTAGYEIAEAEEPEETTKEEPEQDESEEQAKETQTVDVSEDEEAAAMPSTIEEYYGIKDITIQYNGYELSQSYPPSTEENNMFFAMDATEGMQLLVLKFTAYNTSGSDQTLDMLGHGARFRVSLNGEASKGALATMLLNDMQTYKDVIPAGSSTELVSIVEIPQSVSVGTIEFILRGNGENAVLTLQ